jgi:hypothetical protein
LTQSKILLETSQTTQHWKNIIANSKELLPMLRARNVDLKASHDLKMFSVPPWFLSFAMKIAIRYLPSIKHVLAGHSNTEEIRSYSRDVLEVAERLKIRLPRHEQYKNITRSHDNPKTSPEI